MFTSIHESAGGFRNTVMMTTLTPAMTAFQLNIPDTPVNSRFKIFVPPGSVSIMIKFAAPRDAKIGVYFRLGNSALDMISDKSSPFASCSDLSLAREYVQYSRNAGGVGSMIEWSAYKDGIATSIPEWLYCRVDGDPISFVQCKIIVRKSEFLAWFNNAKWDANGNPVISVSDTQTTPPFQPPGIQTPEKPTETVGGVSHTLMKADIDYFFEQLRRFSRVSTIIENAIDDSKKPIDFFK